MKFMICRFDTQKIKKLAFETARAKSRRQQRFQKFLSKLDDFDLNEYIKVIKFDELKVPSVPFQIPSSKTYFGIKEMMGSVA